MKKTYIIPITKVSYMDTEIILAGSFSMSIKSGETSTTMDAKASEFDFEDDEFDE